MNHDIHQGGGRAARTRRRDRLRLADPLLWTAAAGAALAVAYLVAVVLTRDLNQLRVDRLAGAALLGGGDLYAGPVNVGRARLQLYFTEPPFAAVPSAGLALLSWPLAKAVTAVVSGLAVLGCTLLLAGQVGRSRQGAAMPGLSANARWRLALFLVPVALLLDPVWGTVALGQPYLVLVALLLLDGSDVLPPRLRGVLTGLAVGLQPLNVVFVAGQLLNRRWRQAATAALTAVATVGVGWLLAPAGTAAYFGRHLFELSRGGEPSRIDNQSLYGLASRMAERSTALPLWAVLAALTLALTAAAAHRAHRADQPLLATALVGVGGLLAAPFSWAEQWCWLPVALVALVAACWHRSWSPALTVLALPMPLLVRGPVSVVHDARWLEPYQAHGASLLTSNLLALYALATTALAWLVLGRLAPAERPAPPAGPVAPQLTLPHPRDGRTEQRTVRQPALVGVVVEPRGAASHR